MSERSSKAAEVRLLGRARACATPHHLDLRKEVHGSGPFAGRRDEAVRILSEHGWARPFAEKLAATTGSWDTCEAWDALLVEATERGMLLGTVACICGLGRNCQWDVEVEELALEDELARELVLALVA